MADIIVRFIAGLTLFYAMFALSVLWGLSATDAYRAALVVLVAAGFAITLAKIEEKK